MLMTNGTWGLYAQAHNFGVQESASALQGLYAQKLRPWSGAASLGGPLIDMVAVDAAAI